MFDFAVDGVLASILGELLAAFVLAAARKWRKASKVGSGKKSKEKLPEGV